MNFTTLRKAIVIRNSLKNHQIDIMQSFYEGITVTNDVFTGKVLKSLMDFKNSLVYLDDFLIISIFYSLPQTI